MRHLVWMAMDAVQKQRRSFLMLESILPDNNERESESERERKRERESGIVSLHPQCATKGGTLQEEY